MMKKWEGTIARATQCPWIGYREQDLNGEEYKADNGSEFVIRAVEQKGFSWWGVEGAENKMVMYRACMEFFSIFQKLFIQV